MKKLVIFSLLASVALLIGAILYDPALDKRAQQIVNVEPAHIAPSENGYYYFVGLDAPEGADPHAFGLTKDPASPLPELNGDPPPVGLPATEAVLKENETMISRYFKLADYPHFVSDFKSPLLPYPMPYVQDYANLRMAYDAATGNGDKAIEDWLKFTNFLHRAIADGNSPVYQDALMNALVRHVECLKEIFDADPALAKKYLTQIQTALSVPAYGPDVFDLDTIFAAHYRELEYMMDTMPPKTTEAENLKENSIDNRNKLINSVFAVYTAIGQVADTPPNDTTEAKIYKIEKDEGLLNPDYLLGIFFDNPDNLFFISNGQVLYLKRWQVVAIMRMWGAYTAAMAEGIEPDKMAVFVNTLPPRWNNPYTNEPFEWYPSTSSLRADTREIYGFDSNYMATYKRGIKEPTQ